MPKFDSKSHDEASIVRKMVVQKFSKNLYQFLRQPESNLLGKNQPKFVLSQAVESTAYLSRLFDEFAFPSPSYKTVVSLEEKGQLRNFLADFLDDISPILLNEEKNALNSLFIDAIGVDKYQAIKENAKGNEQEIACQVLKGVVLALAHRVLDKAPHADKENAVRASECIERLAGNVNTSGLERTLVKSHDVAGNVKLTKNEIATIINKLEDYIQNEDPDKYDDLISSQFQAARMFLDRAIGESTDENLSKALELYDGIQKEVCPSSEDESEKGSPTMHNS